MNTNIKSISIIGLGWLGFDLGKNLLSKGFKVKGSTTTVEKIPTLSASGIETLLFTISQETIIDESIAEKLLDTDLIFINLPPKRREPNIETIFPLKVQKIIDAAEKFGEKRYIFISSTSVYGGEKGIVTEKSPVNPTTASGRALAEVEQRLRKRLGNRLTIVRPSGLVGGERKAGRFFAGRKDIPGGNAPVNMIHRIDVIGIIASIIEQKQFGTDFNITAPTHPPKSVFYCHQAKKQGFDAPSFLADKPRSAFKIIDNKKVLNTLNYNFVYPDVMHF